jgi:hypothetical protein
MIAWLRPLQPMPTTFSTNGTVFTGVMNIFISSQPQGSEWPFFIDGVGGFSCRATSHALPWSRGAGGDDAGSIRPSCTPTPNMLPWNRWGASVKSAWASKWISAILQTVFDQFRERERLRRNVPVQRCTVHKREFHAQNSHHIADGTYFNIDRDNSDLPDSMLRWGVLHQVTRRQGSCTR